MQKLADVVVKVPRLIVLPLPILFRMLLNIFNLEPFLMFVLFPFLLSAGKKDLTIGGGW